MRLNTNISAIIANNALQKAQDRLSNSIQKLSSGYKINSSADDPAGCAISEKMFSFVDSASLTIMLQMVFLYLIQQKAALLKYSQCLHV
jgi:flagellin-like hook-associated protein FlgL